MIKALKKKFRPRIKARIRKNKQILNKNVKSIFDWVKGAELVELKECNTAEDPVRPELDNDFRTGYGRKIYGVKYKEEIHAVMCFAYTNKIPTSVEELEKLSTDAFFTECYERPKYRSNCNCIYCLVQKKRWRQTNC